MAAGFDSSGSSSLFSDLPGPPKQAVVCLSVCVRVCVVCCVCVCVLSEEENSLDLRHKQSVASFFGCDQKYQLWDSFDGCDQIHVAGTDDEMQIETTRLGSRLFPLHVIKKENITEDDYVLVF